MPSRLVLLAIIFFAQAAPAAADLVPTRDAARLAATLDAGVPVTATLPFIPPAPDAQAECANGADDDFDGLTDAGADPGCTSGTDNREQDDPLAQCANGEDDDGDGFVDFSPPFGQTTDPGCSAAQDDNEIDGEVNPTAACGNGTDDDGDDLTDLADPGCEDLEDLDEGSEGLPLGADSNPAAVGTVPVLGGFPTAGSDYLILSTGSTLLADDPNNSGGSGQVNGDAPGINAYGADVKDLIQLKLELMVPEGVNCARMSFRFLSEEFPEYVGSSFNDGFVAELDASAFTASRTAISAPHNFAFDNAGKVVSINTTGFSEAQAAGTTYDGATPLLRASTPITSGAHTVYLTIFDLGDAVLDSAVFVDHLRLVAVPEGTCITGASSDDAPPETTLTQTPAEPLADSTATFAFTSSEPDGGSFQCRIDGNPFITCSSPYTVDAPAPGTHAFEVRAVDAAGNLDPTPARHEFTVGAVGGAGTDLTISIDDPSKAVKAGGAYSYVFRVRNAGANRADSVVLDTDLPATGAFIYTKGRADCSGTQDLRCDLGALEPGQTVPVEVRMVTGQIPTGVPGAGPSGGIAAAKTSRLFADATVTSTTTDTNPANDRDAERTTLKAPAADFDGRKPSKVVGRASGIDPAYGWYKTNSENEWWGASNWRGFSSGGKSGYGALQTHNIGWQRNVPFRFDPPFRPPIVTYKKMWQATDFQLQVWACTGFSTSCSSSKWKTVSDLTGFAKPSVSGGKVTSENPGFGGNPFFRARSDRDSAKSRYWQPGIAQWSLGTPGQTYRLRSRWTYWRDRIGPRDEVHQTGWVQMAVVRSGSI